jgi:ElaB/YqjD/DUF883 family membrane-anchored ribosome-binding protein
VGAPPLDIHFVPASALAAGFGRGVMDVRISHRESSCGPAKGGRALPVCVGERKSRACPAEPCRGRQGTPVAGRVAAVASGAKRGVAPVYRAKTRFGAALQARWGCCAAAAAGRNLCRSFVLSTGGFMDTATPNPNTSSSPSNAANGAAGNPQKVVDRAAQAAHQTVDRVAAAAGPALERLRSGASNAAETLQSKADRLGELEEQWLTTARDYVREHPLTAVAIGVMAGLLIGRMGRSD